MKNIKLIAISSFVAIALCICTLLIYNKINNNHKFDTNKRKDNANFINLNNKPKKDKSKYSTFPGLKMEKTPIKLSYEGNDLDVTLPIYIDRNRYYLPLTEIIDDMNGTMETKDEYISIKLNNRTIDINTKDNTFKTDNDIHKLKQKLINLDSITYISMFDFTNMFDLKPSFEYDKNTIMLFNNKEKLPISKAPLSQKVALLRLEDMTAGKTYRYADAESIYKLRIVADYLYSKGIPFHVAWVPRYIDLTNGNNIDNDLANNNNINNADFLYTLDYFMDKGGIIGLHGYTHQAANEKSIDSIEFGNPKDRLSYTNEYAIKKVNMAKESARELSIPIGFFEAPHYSTSPNQLKILENNFDFLYEPYTPDVVNGNTYITVKRTRNRIIKYIPTPLNYLDGKNDLPNMFKKINNLKPEAMASFFFHPNIEFEDINVLKEANGYPSYTYSDQSALHQIINTIENKGYSFETINQLN
jgi:hypothetical protein